MKHILILITVSLLGACSGSKQALHHDAAAYRQAVKVEDPKPPVTIVEVPKPLPLPGQLKPLPSRDVPAGGEAPSPTDTIETVAETSLREPKATQYLNAVQVYPYTKGALYKLYAAPGQVTDIALQEGEQLISVSAGDTLRWIIGDTMSGTGAGTQVHILVKAQEAGLKTNMVILTNRRSYYLELESLEATYMASVAWHYPGDALIALKRENAEALERAAREVTAGLDLARLNFRYKIKGDPVPWKPLRAFDDGRKVYIQFPSHIMQTEVPPLFVLGADGKAELVNYRMKAGYFIVDKLFMAAELRAGSDPEQRVRILRQAMGGRSR